MNMNVEQRMRDILEDYDVVVTEYSPGKTTATTTYTANGKNYTISLDHIEHYTEQGFQVRVRRVTPKSQQILFTMWLADPVLKKLIHETIAYDIAREI